MAEKAVLISDTHFKFGTQFDRTGSNGLSMRLQEIIDSIRWAAATGKEKGATLFIMGGDIFERPEKLPTKEGLAIQNLFIDLSKQFKHVLSLVGNHDQLSRESSILDLYNPTITVFNKPTILDTKSARLFFVPYIREPQDLYAVINQFATQDTVNKKYLFAHFWDSTVVPVDPDAIDISKFPANFFDRIFCGHYHVPSKLTTSPLIYMGTLLNKSFGETGKKGCWILDMDKNKTTFIENPHSPEFFSTTDTNILSILEANELNTNAYYRIFTDPENVTQITTSLGPLVKGFELLQKKESESSTSVSIENIEKKNLQSFKDYILENCSPFKPADISLDEFKEKGAELLQNI